MRTFYGVPMTTGATPDEAAEAWKSSYSNAFTGNSMNLGHLVRRTELDGGRFTVFVYREYNGQTPVSNFVRLLVLNGSPACVVYASGWFYAPLPSGFAPSPIGVTAQEALQIVQETAPYDTLNEWGQPTLLLFGGGPEPVIEPPIPTWEFFGRRIAPHPVKAYTFFVSALTGSLLYIQDDVYSADVSGHVTGYATPGTLPDVDYNPPVLVDLSDVRVSLVSPGLSTVTDINGDYTISFDGPWPVTVRAELTGGTTGPSFNVFTEDIEGQEECPVFGEFAGVEPPDLETDFVLNEGPVLDCPDEPNVMTTAQINALVHVRVARDFFTDRHPALTELDMQNGEPVQLAIEVNDTDPTPGHPCNARQTGHNLFFSEERSVNCDDNCCVNVAYSSWIAHEYGHFVLLRLNLNFLRPAFGEGFSDSVATLAYNDPVMGRDWRGPGVHNRDLATADVAFPCPNGIAHICGQILARAWWDVKLKMEAHASEPAEGLELARRLFTTWALVTAGPAPWRTTESATPQTAIEVLTVDDDDGNLHNGTPHDCAICWAFAGRSIPCPEPYPDCGGNGIPDECEADCNANGVPDDCEPDHDCNFNGVPDECEGSGDFDFDCIRDLDDYYAFDACTSGPGAFYTQEIDCIYLDVDGDMDVDLQDFYVFQYLFGTSPDYCTTPAGPCDSGTFAPLAVSTNLLVTTPAEVLPNSDWVNEAELSPTERVFYYAGEPLVDLALMEPDPPAFLYWEVDGVPQTPGETSITIKADQARTAVAVFDVCTSHEDCEDADACTRDRCGNGNLCAYTPLVYGDVDANGVVNLFDVFTILDLIGGEPLAGLTFEDVDIHPCGGDGAVNLFDIFAVLDAIGGTDPCCGSALAGGGMGLLSIASVDVKMGDGLTTVISPGSQVEIRAYGDEYVDLRGFEVQVQVTGGTGGTLTLEEVFIDDQRADFAFYGQEQFSASNVEDARAVCAMSSGGVNSTEDKYLGTFVFRASQDASGTFTVSAVPGDGVTGTLAGDSAGEAMTVNIVQDASVRIQNW